MTDALQELRDKVTARAEKLRGELSVSRTLIGDFSAARQLMRQELLARDEETLAILDALIQGNKADG